MGRGRLRTPSSIAEQRSYQRNGTRPIRDVAGSFLITGHVPGTLAAHTGADVPPSAYGRGASLLGGTIDNTDVFFSLMPATLGGVIDGGRHGNR